MVLWELLTREKPYKGQTKEDIMRAVTAREQLAVRPRLNFSGIVHLSADMQSLCCFRCLRATCLQGKAVVTHSCIEA